MPQEEPMASWWVFAALVISCACASARAAAEAGVRSYLADLAVPGGALRMVLRLEDDGDATLDIPAQGIQRLALQVTGGPGGALSMRIPVAVPATIDLRPVEGRLEGSFRQGTFAAPISFRPGEPSRPQDPVPPLPYETRDVDVRHPAGHVLAGTLVLPPGASAAARVPAVVFVTGSGPQDRDESIMGHRPFLVMADALARRGIASLRCDDRGTGRSTGSFENATSDDLATDAEASFDWLVAQAGIDAARTGFLGHSEGGMTGPMATVAIDRRPGGGPRPAFVVMLAGTGVDGASILKGQTAALFGAAGVNPDALAKVIASHAALVDAAVAGKSADELRTLAAVMVDAQLAASGAAAAVDPAQRDQAVTGTVTQMRAPWMRRFMALDPSVALRSLRCPVLALFAERDLQVLPSQNEAPVAAALRDAGVAATVRTMPGLNHLFQPAARGTIDEYAVIDVTVDPGVLALVGDWILAQPPRPPASR
jgi:hypothetical protein